MVWSIGANLIDESRIRFDVFLKEFIKNNTVSESSNLKPRNMMSSLPVDDEFTCFDYKLKIGNSLSNEQEPSEIEEYDENEEIKNVLSNENFINSKQKYWETWYDELNKVFNKYSIPKNGQFDEIIVPTIDKIRHLYFLNLFLNKKSIKNSSVLFVGSTGTGKTSYSIDYLLRNSAKLKLSPIIMNFSAQTTSNKTQDIIMEALIKHRKGVYGPQIDRKCVSLLVKHFFLWTN